MEDPVAFQSLPFELEVASKRDSFAHELAFGGTADNDITVGTTVNDVLAWGFRILVQVEKYDFKHQPANDHFIGDDKTAAGDRQHRDADVAAAGSRSFRCHSDPVGLEKLLGKVDCQLRLFFDIRYPLEIGGQVLRRWGWLLLSDFDR